MVNFLSKHYNWILITITFISLIFLISNNISSLWLFKYYDSDESYSNGNGVWNNILTGFICSTIFYWIVDYIPNLQRKIAYREDVKIYFEDLETTLGAIVNEYLKYYFKKNINEITSNDFKFGNLNLYDIRAKNLDGRLMELRFLMYKTSEVDSIIKRIENFERLEYIDHEIIKKIKQFKILPLKDVFFKYGHIFKEYEEYPEIITFKNNYIGENIEFIFDFYKLIKKYNNKIKATTK